MVALGLEKTLILIIALGSYPISICTGIDFSNYFDRHNRMTWLPEFFRTYNNSHKTACAQACLDYNKCIGFQLANCLYGFCTCILFAKHQNDTVIFSHVENVEVWARNCPEGYESIPANAVPLRCYKVRISNNNIWYDDAEKMCTNDGAGVHLISTETRTELEEILGDVKPHLVRAGISLA